MKRITVGVVLGFCLVGAQTGQVPNVEDFVVTEKFAYAMLDPEAIAASGVIQVEWSPTGRYLLMVQERPQLNPAQVVDLVLRRDVVRPQQRLVVWDRVTRKTQDYGPIEAINPSLGEAYWGSASREIGPLFGWFEGVDVGYLELSEDDIRPRFPTVPATLGLVDPRPQANDQKYIRTLDLARGRVDTRPLRGRPSGDFGTDTVACPALPVLLVIQNWTPSTTSSEMECTIWTFDSSGREGAPVRLGAGFGRLLHWADNGQAAILSVSSRDAAGVRHRQLIRFDVKTGTMSTIDQAPPPYIRPDRSGPIELRYTPSQTAAGTVTVSHFAVWLSAKGPSDNPAVLVSAGSVFAALNPNVDMVAVLDRGVAMVRPIVAISIISWIEANKTQALEHAKQAALALIMYGADYDDLLPPANLFSEGVVEPYAKNRRPLERFVFLLGGTNLTSIQNPMTTVLGYIPGIGGHAVAYADGHVNWEPKKP